MALTMAMATNGSKALSAFEDVIRRYDGIVDEYITLFHCLDLHTASMQMGVAGQILPRNRWPMERSPDAGIRCITIMLLVHRRGISEANTSGTVLLIQRPFAWAR